jgi:hypothetical protein
MGITGFAITGGIGSLPYWRMKWVWSVVHYLLSACSNIFIAGQNSSARHVSRDIGRKVLRGTCACCCPKLHNYQLGSGILALGSQTQGGTLFWGSQGQGCDHAI